MDRRMKRRITGAFSKRLDEAHFEAVADDRDGRGKKWRLGTVLRIVVLSMVAGMRSLAEVEELTSDLSLAMRRRFRIRRRLPDTTARDILCGLVPQALVPRLHQIVRQAARRKAITHDGIPFGTVSLDGKGTALPAVDGWYAQDQTQKHGKLTGVVRTITATLTSSSARPVIDVTPMPADTNEVGWFQSAFEHLMQAYGRGDWLRLVTYDAGATSLDNANTVRAHGVHYLFGLKGTQPSLLQEARRLLAGRTETQCDAETIDSDGTIRRLYLHTVDPGLCGWQHLRTLLRVTHTHTDKSGELKTETRYFLCSMPSSRLTPDQWLLVIRRHWGVETVHQVLDVSFKEDDKPWIKSNPRGAAVVMILRRIAYTMMTFFRSVTLRSDGNRLMAWKSLMRQVSITLLATTDEEVADLRRHAVPIAPS